MKCRHCGSELRLPFLDLGTAPPSNAYLDQDALQRPEIFFPLRLLVCEQCWLVQTEDYADRSALFTEDYAYFSSVSTSWLDHAARYVTKMRERFSLGTKSWVVEIAANDGYLLQYVKAAGIPCLGIEPTASTATAARAKGIEIVESFFGIDLATQLVSGDRHADLIAANNVLAHVPDINDFVSGIALLLAPQGVATFEFPHLLKMIQLNQFDTAYHEHFSYLSLTAVQRIFEANGLTVFDVEELPTHGGSLRVYAQKSATGTEVLTRNVGALLSEEKSAGIAGSTLYQTYQGQAEKVKNETLNFLLAAKSAGQRIGAYGAAAKGNTLLNFAGIRADLLPYVVDRNPSKQGKYLPGSRIPILTEDYLREQKPDFVLILPWNLRDEITQQMSYVRAWGGKFVVCVPQLEVLA